MPRPKILGKLTMSVPAPEPGSPWLIHHKFLEGIAAEADRLHHRTADGPTQDMIERVVLTLLGIERRP